MNDIYIIKSREFSDRIGYQDKIIPIFETGYFTNRKKANTVAKKLNNSNDRRWFNSYFVDTIEVHNPTTFSKIMKNREKNND